MILIPGYWLGGWAWDDVVKHLDVTATPVTLPGLDSPATRRGDIRLADHVGTIVDLVNAAASTVVLVVHSGAGALASAITDQLPGKVRRVVFVESGPVADGTIARPDLEADAVELPLPPWDELEAGGASLADLTDDMLQRFKQRANPHPAGPLREPVRLHNPARNAVPTTIVCCSCPSAVIRQMAADGNPMFAPLSSLADVSYVDLPTGHWPMWSKPEALAKVLAEAARD